MHDLDDGLRRKRRARVVQMDALLASRCIRTPPLERRFSHDRLAADFASGALPHAARALALPFRSRHCNDPQSRIRLTSDCPIYQLSTFCSCTIDFLLSSLLCPTLCAERRVMVKPNAWFDRAFTFDLPLGAFPAVLERLRGTPARAAELVAGLPPQVLTRRVNGKWSIQEHIGHLADLGVLDDKRLEGLPRRRAKPDRRRPPEPRHRDRGPQPAADGRCARALARRSMDLVRRMEPSRKRKWAAPPSTPASSNPCDSWTGRSSWPITTIITSRTCIRRSRKRDRSGAVATPRSSGSEPGQAARAGAAPAAHIAAC